MYHTYTCTCRSKNKGNKIKIPREWGSECLKSNIVDYDNIHFLEIEK